MNEIYERANAALVLAQTNVERSRERTEKLQGLCSCASLAAFPLWWQPTQLQSPAQLLAGHMFYGQVARVAQLAVQHIQVLLHCSKAALFVTKEGGARAGSSQRLDVYEGSGPDAEVGRREMSRPTGHGAHGGLLGRCLRREQLMNISEPAREDRYNAEVDGRDRGATLFLPLKWAGKAVLGVLRVKTSSMSVFIENYIVHSLILTVDHTDIRSGAQATTRRKATVVPPSPVMMRSWVKFMRRMSPLLSPMRRLWMAEKVLVLEGVVAHRAGL